MKKGNVRKIDFSAERLGLQADKYYNEGKYLAALRLAYRQYDLYGGDGDIFTRLSDIYESMDLHSSALNWWYRFLDIAHEDELPDIYEGLAVNYLNMGNESQSAYYYNQLVDVDATLPEETKLDIAEAFSKDQTDKFRFAYPPELADYSKELDAGSRALKLGDCKRAIQILDGVAKGSKAYVHAKEMQSVAYLLAGEMNEAENLCTELLADNPEDVRVLATLAAVYLEQGRKEESREIALKLFSMPQEHTEELYKVATVCCENGLHEQAYEKFTQLEEKIPFDGRMLYFKAVAAYKCGKLEESERALDTLCTVYPDAEVAKYYLRVLRGREEHGIDPSDEPSYFYHLPQEERENRCRALIRIGNSSKDEAQLFGLIALHDGYFRWCFDEMDGGDHDLQYLALVTAVHVRADEFIREVLLDCEVADFLKIETLRMLCERNEDIEVGAVLCHIYRKLFMPKIRIGRKKRRKFIDGYAKIVSKFVVVNDDYGERLKTTAENLYAALEKHDSLDLIDSEDDCACAIFLLAGLKELGSNRREIVATFKANEEKVNAFTAIARNERYGEKAKCEEKEE